MKQMSGEAKGTTDVVRNRVQVFRRNLARTKAKAIIEYVHYRHYRKSEPDVFDSVLLREYAAQLSLLAQELDEAGG